MLIKTVGAAQSMVTDSVFDLLENCQRLDLSQANVSRTYCGDNPDESPAVGVKHR